MFKTINTPKLPMKTEAILIKLSSSLYMNLEKIITKMGEVKRPAATWDIGKKAKHPKYINIEMTIKAVL